MKIKVASLEVYPVTLIVTEVPGQLTISLDKKEKHSIQCLRYHISGSFTHCRICKNVEIG